MVLSVLSISTLHASVKKLLGAMHGKVSEFLNGFGKASGCNTDDLRL